ncbi:MAG: sugar transferase [bacterium]
MNLGTPLDTSNRRGSAAVRALALMPTKGSRRAGRWWLTDPARRFLNVLVAVVAIVTLAPLMLLIAVLVGLSSRGPVIYRQSRIGLDRRRRHSPGSESGRRRLDRGGRVFMIYKFRTMVEDPSTGQVWATRDDPRVTKIGRILRAARLDELPQLFNVLMGDMNIVGPRPEQPEIFARLQDILPSFRKRQRVLPGITGLAQVTAGYDRSLEDVRRKIKFDLEYIRRRSPLKDLTIMARTIPVMVFPIPPVRSGASNPNDLVPSTGMESTFLVREG